MYGSDISSGRAANCRSEPWCLLRRASCCWRPLAGAPCPAGCTNAGTALTVIAFLTAKGTNDALRHISNSATRPGGGAFMRSSGKPPAAVTALALFAEEPSSGRFLLHAVAGGGTPGGFVHARMEASPRSFRTFTDVCPGTHLFEREIYDLFGLVPEGHPELNPLRCHEAWPKKFFPLRSSGAPAPDARRGYGSRAGRGSTRWRSGRSMPDHEPGASAFPARETVQSPRSVDTSTRTNRSPGSRGWEGPHQSRSLGTPP
jgi:hypothetical protein